MDDAQKVIEAKIAEAILIGERRGMERAEIIARSFAGITRHQAEHVPVIIANEIKRAAKEGE